MQPPARVRVYGILMTKRTYLRFVTAGFIGLGAVFAIWILLYAETAAPNPELLAVGQSMWIVLWGFLRSYIPVILLVAGLLEALEILLVLRRFRTAEAEQARTQPPSVSKGN